MAAPRTATGVTLGGIAFAASAVTQALVFRLPVERAFFAVMVAPVLVGAIVVLSGAWSTRLSRASAALAGIAAPGAALTVLMLTALLESHAFLPFHATYLAIAWVAGCIPVALVAALMPPRRPEAEVAP